MASLVAVTLAAAIGIACDDPLIQTCGEIPPGGCRSGPIGCTDPSCAAVYTCVGAAWRLNSICANDGPTTPSEDAGDDAHDDAATRDAAFDAPPGAFGGPGCIGLALPDCALGTALACTTPSCCGCEDLFVCRNGGWDLWGACVGGQPVPR